MMTTASTAALVVGGGQTVFAQEGLLPEGYSLSVQGGYGIANNALYDKVEASDSGGPISDELSDKIGDEDSFRQITGSASLSRELAPGRDMRFGFRGGLTVDDEVSTTETFEDESITFGTRSNFSYAALDFDLGYTLPASGIDLRGFIGARALTSNSELEKFGEFDSGGPVVNEFSQATISEFTGIGPRAGVGFSTPATPLGTAGDFSLSGELAASYLFGERKDIGESNSGGETEEFFSETNDLEVTTLEAQIGVNYHISPNSKLSVGYELQQFWNVDGFSDSDDETGFGDDAEPRLIHGVFIGFSTTF